MGIRRDDLTAEYRSRSEHSITIPAPPMVAPPAAGDFWQRPIASAAESVCIVTAMALPYLALGEIAIRIAMHAPLLEWRDFRHERAAAAINHLVQYDGVLGWRLKAHLKSARFNTLEYGFAPTTARKQA